MTNVASDRFSEGGQSIYIQATWLTLDVPAIHFDDLRGFEARQDFGEGSLPNSESVDHPPLGEPEAADLVVSQSAEGSEMADHAPR
jgi:hypothetical protein